jgi:hypothetical protein
MPHRIDPKAVALLRARPCAARGAAACSPDACARASGPRHGTGLRSVRHAPHASAVDEARQSEGGRA